MYNVAIIGAGPAGIFSALEIVKLKPEWKVVLIEKGQKIEKRKCPIREGSPKCVNCKRCGLLCGWVGWKKHQQTMQEIESNLRELKEY